MKSIDKLLEWAERNASTWGMDEIDEIADEIEREVEELRDRDYHNGREDAKGAVEFADRLKAAVDKREDVTLFGADYTSLPVDADGMPIHAGDVLDGYGKTIEVVELRIGRSGWVIVSRDGNAYADCAAFTHHHAPTVEDVLREFAQEMNENLGMYTGEAIDADEWRKADERTIAEYAAKLRLAGEE